MRMGFFMFNGMFSIVFFLIIGVFVYIIVSGIGTWRKNNNSPRLIVDAVVVSKRTNVSHHHGQNSIGSTSTSYYVTFEVETGDRMELRVSGQEFGMLVEGDYGRLSFQGSRYLGFER